MARKTNYTKNGIDYYRVTVTVGRDASGKPIRKEFYGNSKKDAENKRDEYLKKLRDGLAIDHQTVTLGSLMHTWLFEVVRVSDKIKPSTFERYEGIYRNYVKDSLLYGLKLHNLKSIQIQRYYNRLYDSGKSNSQIKNLNKLLKKFFYYAVDEGYLIRNPCTSKNIVIPGEVEDGDRVIEIFTNDEIDTLKAVLKGHRYECLFLLALGTGLRQGELLGLTWEHVDTKKSTIEVTQTIRQGIDIDENGNRSYTLFIQPTKTKNSRRTVPIPSSLIPTLEKHRIKQKEEKLKAGEFYEENGFVFATEVGRPINARNLIRSHKRILKKAKIQYRRFHAYRHTYATKLFEKGVPIKTVQMLLGHSDISVTANIYTHVMPELKIEAVEAINDLFA